MKHPQELLNSKEEAMAAGIFYMHQMSENNVPGWNPSVMLDEEGSWTVILTSGKFRLSKKSCQQWEALWIDQDRDLQLRAAYFPSAYVAFQMLTKSMKNVALDMAYDIKLMESASTPPQQESES